MIIHSSMTKLIFKSKKEIVITDYVDYPVLHITITYTGIFFRKFSVVFMLHQPKMESSNGLRETNIENWKCDYFCDITEIEDFHFCNISLYKESNENILVYYNFILKIDYCKTITY